MIESETEVREIEPSDFFLHEKISKYFFKIENPENLMMIIIFQFLYGDEIVQF